MPIIQQGLFGDYLAYCGRCGRGLRNPLSVKRGIGPVCWRKMHKGKEAISDAAPPKAATHTL